VPASGDVTTSGAPADQPTFGSAGTTAPGANSLYGAYGVLADAAGENINGKNVSIEPTGPNDPEVTNATGQQLQPGPGASGFIDRPTGLAGESPNLSGSPGTATEPALVAQVRAWCSTPRSTPTTPGDLFRVRDPADTFVGAVSDTGPVALSSNASTTTASNNYAKPWLGSFQLLNDSGQPVTLTSGFIGNITLGAREPSRRLVLRAVPVGAKRQRPPDVSRSTRSTTQLTSPRARRHRHGVDQSADQARHRVEHVLQPLQHPADNGGPASHRSDLQRTVQRRYSAGRWNGLRGPRREGSPGLRRASGAGDLRHRRLYRTVLHDAFVPSGILPVGGNGSSTVYCPAYFRLGRSGSNGQNGFGSHGGTGGTGGAPGCGTDGGNGGGGGAGVNSAGVGGNGGNGGNGACPPEEWSNGMWLSASGAATTPYDTPPCNGTWGDGGSGGNGGNGVHSTPGQPGGNGGNGTPGKRGADGANGATVNATRTFRRP